MTDLERLLAETGARWRVSQPEPPAVNLDRLGRRRSATVRRWAPLAAVAAVVAIVLAVIVPLANRPAAGPVTPGQTPWPTLPPDSGDGVPVGGIGYLVREEGVTKLCREILQSDDVAPPAVVSCAGVYVGVAAVPDELLTMDTDSGLVRYSRHVRVEGSYHAGLLTVTSGAPVDVDRPSPPLAAVPCPPPSGGWQPGRGGPEPRSEAEKTALRDAVVAHRDRYTEPWVAFPAGLPSTEPLLATLPQVYVVGTTGDVDAARAELSAIYQGNLCVHHVTRSQDDLDAIVNALQSISSQPIQAEVALELNHVRVGVIALDPPTNAILDSVGRDSLVIDEPLLQWLD